NPTPIWASRFSARGGKGPTRRSCAPMADDRIPTHLWVTAHLRRCSAEGIPAVVIHSGDRMGGSVMLKLYEPPDRCRLFTLMRNLDGRLAWYPAHKEEHIDEVEAGARIG